MKKLIRVVALFLIALAVTACGGDDSDGGSDNGGTQESINVVMYDMYFGETNDNQANPPEWAVTSGSRVTVNLDNKGVLEHTWAVVKIGETLPDTIGDPSEVEGMLLTTSKTVVGEDTGVHQFTAPEPGTYVVICTIAGHYPLMQGRLVVN